MATPSILQAIPQYPRFPLQNAQFPSKNPLSKPHTTSAGLAKCLGKPWASRHCDLYYRELTRSQNPPVPWGAGGSELQKRSCFISPTSGRPTAPSPPLLAAACVFGQKTSNFRVIWKSLPKHSQALQALERVPDQIQSALSPPHWLPPAEPIPHSEPQ